jgi:hypothetical protein
MISIFYDFRKFLALSFALIIFSFLKNEALSRVLEPVPTLEPKVRTSLEYSGDFQGQYSDLVKLKVLLKETKTNKGLANQPIEWFLGQQKAVSQTNEVGFATLEILLNQNPGDYNLIVIFPGNKDFQSSSLTLPFKIEKEELIINFQGPFSGKPAENVVFQAVLLEKDDFVGELKGKRVYFNLESQEVSYATDSQGRIQTNFVLPSVPGSYNLKIDFKGDANYLPVQALFPIQVEAPKEEPETPSLKTENLAPKKKCLFFSLFGADKDLILSLRLFRDELLEKNPFGKILVKNYYQVSFSLGESFDQERFLKEGMANLFKFFLKFLKFETIKNV